MSLFIDTNTVLRVAQPSHSLYPVSLKAVKALIERREELFVTPQVMAECWNVATRPPAYNGLGLSIQMTIAKVFQLEELCSILAETEEVYLEWKRLVTKHRVSGVRVHDARLVAAMNVYGIKQILTFNTDDFARYDIETIHPSQI